MPESIEGRIKNVLVDSLNLEMDPAAIPDDLPLIGKGLGLDSVSVLHLIGAVEEAFNIQIDDAEIGRGLLRNVASLSGYVRTRLEARASAS